MISALISFLGGSVFRMLNCAACLAQTFSKNVCRRRLIHGVKQPKVLAFPAVAFALGHVFSSTYVKTNPQNSGFVVRPSASQVLQVRFMVNTAEVFIRVVCSVSINVINTLIRPFASNKKYGTSMGIVLPSGNGNFDVAMRLKPPSHLALFCGAVVFAARKHACLLVVNEKFSQSFGGKIGISHEDSLIVRLVRSHARFPVLRGFAILRGMNHV